MLFRVFITTTSSSASVSDFNGGRGGMGGIVCEIDVGQTQRIFGFIRFIVVVVLFLKPTQLACIMIISG